MVEEDDEEVSTAIAFSRGTQPMDVAANPV